MNTSDLSIEVTATPVPAPQLQAALAGSAELMFWAKVEISRIDSYQAKETRSDKSVSFQVLPSVLTIGGKTIVRSHAGHVHSASLDTSGRKAEQTIPLYWALSRDQILGVEQERNGRAADFSTKLAAAFRDGAASWTWEFDLKFRVPASDWADLLSAQGTQKRLHVSLPLGPATDLSTNAYLRNEVARAERLYQIGDYSGCVASIRDVWDPIVKELESSGRWDPILDSRLPSEIAGPMKAYTGALRNLVNKGHHRGFAAPTGHTALYDFTQRDAEFILETALAFLRYLGRLAME